MKVHVLGKSGKRIKKKLRLPKIPQFGDYIKEH